MAFDGIVTRAIVTELQNIIGSKIDKIYEPDKNTIILSLYLQGSHYSLNICIDARNCRINLTNYSKINPLVAPNFCMLLRKHLSGGRISNISMLGLERLVQIEIETINEFNEIEPKTLIIELMGKHSNIILVSQNNIVIDAMRRTDTNKNSYRNILPSHVYTLPNSDKLDFTALKNFDEFYSKIANRNIELSKAISNTFTGFSLSFVEFAIQECGNLTINSSKEEFDKLYTYICNILNNTPNLSFKLIYKNNIVSDYVLTLNSNVESCSLNSFIDDFYFKRETSETFINYRNSILKLILDILKKYNNRLLSINSKLEECNNMDKYKLYGELITANLYRISDSHLSSIKLENYYDNNNLINIPLDKKYSVSNNAKRYFKKYNKLKNALEICTKQKIDTENELNYIESIIYELENAKDIHDIDAIYTEISENTIFKDSFKEKNVKKKMITKTSLNPIEVNCNGYTILIGKNNIGNDYLTTKIAHQHDLWFHTKDIHGSHVILKLDNIEPNDDIIYKCAQIAAFHSKAKLSSKVPVDYCYVKYVKKPNKSKPGMVIYTHNKTLYVEPKNYFI